MSGPVRPPSPSPSTVRAPGSTPSPGGARRAPRAGKAAEQAFDPVTRPINRGPHPPAADREENQDDGSDSAGFSDPADFFAAAQPSGEDGVTEDMSTLAINPTQFQPGSLTANDFQLGQEQFESEAGAPGPELHLSGDFAHMDDAAIMLELKAGNMAGFDFLIQKYRKPIINFMYRMTRNQAIAEELAQEVFLRVYRSRETYRAEARFSTWLYRIATNLGVNQARDTRHERSASTVYLDEADAETGTTPDVADATPDVESKLLRDERMAAIRDHVMALPERQRMAVLMHKYEGMDYSQIGEVLKLSESATKSLLFRAYQTLREKLKGFV